MRLVTFTNLYPSDAQPRHGIFIRERLEQLVATGEVSASVIALRPGRKAPPAETAPNAKIPVHYQRVPALPLLTNWVEPNLWAAAAAPAVAAAIGDDRTDVILDGHFLYPDGAAAVLLGRRLGVPVVLSARGSDVNVKCRNLIMKRWVRWAVARCAAVITVSRALADTLYELGIRPKRLAVIPNGVDHARFDLHDKEACKRRFGVAGYVIASVGHLVPEKGHAIAIEALPDLPDVRLLIVGDGPERHALGRLAQKLGVAERVHFAGLVPHADMPSVYCAAAALVLASVREGMPNVILESLACGTPVVATDVGGIRELLQAPPAGELVRERSAAALVQALHNVRRSGITPEETRSFSRRFSWEPIVRQQLELYGNVLENAHMMQHAVHRS